MVYSATSGTVPFLNKEGSQATPELIIIANSMMEAIEKANKWITDNKMSGDVETVTIKNAAIIS